MNKEQRKGLALMLLAMIGRDTARLPIVKELSPYFAITTLVVAWVMFFYGAHNLTKDQ